MVEYLSYGAPLLENINGEYQTYFLKPRLQTVRALWLWTDEQCQPVRRRRIESKNYSKLPSSIRASVCFI
jgi:hypothetical protein